MKKIHFFNFFLLLGDLFLMYLALFAALFIRDKSSIGKFGDFFYHFLVLYIVWIFIIFVLALYDVHFFKKFKDFILNLIIFSFLAFFTGVAYFYFRPTLWITPKTILLLNVLIFDTLFLFWRYMVNLFLETKLAKEKVIIIGFHRKLNEILPQARKIYDVLALFCPPDMQPGEMDLGALGDLNIISTISELKNMVMEKKVTSIIFSLDFYSHEQLIKEIFGALPLTLSYVTLDELYESITKKISLDHLNEMWFLEKVSRPANMFDENIKRVFDIVFSIIGLSIFIVSLPLITLAIKIDDKGPIFYSQKRFGKNGKPLTIYKFRTMKTQTQQGPETVREANKNTVTAVGNILRKLHLDELPQAWGIFKGELSFVGPRPEPAVLSEIFEKEIPFYKQRFLVKPGLFGWAQIHLPAYLSVDKEREKIEYDLYYIKNRSLLLDVEIILKALKLFFS